MDPSPQVFPLGGQRIERRSDLDPGRLRVDHHVDRTALGGDVRVQQPVLVLELAFGSFGLVTYDRDGQELWRVPAPPPDNRFGSAASPVLVADRLLEVRRSVRRARRSD